MEQSELRQRLVDTLPELKKVVAGGVAGCVSKTAVAPLSRVTVLMQVQSMRPHKFSDGKNPNNQYLWASLRKIYLEEGIAGFWRGNAATCLHRFPYTSFTFYANAAAREALERHGGLPEKEIRAGNQLVDQFQPLYFAVAFCFCFPAGPRAQTSGTAPQQARESQHLLAGGAAAMAAVCTFHPLDVIKTRLMAQTRREYYSGVPDAARKICRDEGARGLYRGIGVSLCSTTPSIAINFTAFEEFKSLFSKLGLEPGVALSLCSGACAGSFASIVMFPLDLVRRQMQMVGVGGRPLVYANVRQAIRSVFITGVRRRRGCPLWWLLGPCHHVLYAEPADQQEMVRGGALVPGLMP
ncbi:unnamed protein product [Effrenium voratum]|uniref:Mitochondrial carrier protein n=1 Tax=Effrenium voratum TaxID=2562239 RepID=A0AA36JE48_9DINO|nr:unnamed protein product [Effrenium voratum]